MGGMATEPSSLSKAKGGETAPSGLAGAAARASDTGAPRSFITPAFPRDDAMGPGASFAGGSASPNLGGKREPERAGFAATPIRGNRKKVRKLSEPNPYSYAKTMEERSRGESLLELGRVDGLGNGGKAGQPSAASGNDTNRQMLEIIRRRQQEAKAQSKTTPQASPLKQPDMAELRTPDGNAPRNLLESAQALAAQRKARDAASPAAQPTGLQPAVFRPGQSLPGGFMPTGQGGIVQARAPSGDNGLYNPGNDLSSPRPAQAPSVAQATEIEEDHKRSGNGPAKESNSASSKPDETSPPAPSLSALREIAPETKWTEAKYTAQQTTIANTTQKAQSDQLPAFVQRDPVAQQQEEYLAFDGSHFMHVRQGKVLRAWPAISGKDGYHGKADQERVEEGPIPEGHWTLRQDRHQSFRNVSQLDRIIGITRFTGPWPGNRTSWGENRIWVSGPNGEERPEKYGRGGFAVHGGETPGSMGCIDLTEYMPDFTSYFTSLGRNLPLIVSYPEPAAAQGKSKGR